MGRTLQEQGKLEKAIEAFKKALSIKPDYAAAHRNLSSMKQYTEDDKHFLQVQKVSKRTGLSENDECQLSFALAKMYEDIGNRNQAFSHLSRGNTLRKSSLNYSINSDKKLFNNLKNTQPKLFKSALEIVQESSGISPVFIVGMPRSGTTLVEQIISSHSDVSGAGELNYVSQFGGHLAVNSTTIDMATISKFRNNYLSGLSKVSSGKQFVTDKMPENFLYIPITLLPCQESKIIHVHRDAAATCWSNFRQYFANDNIGYCYDLNDLVAYYHLYTDL